MMLSLSFLTKYICMVNLKLVCKGSCMCKVSIGYLKQIEESLIKCDIRNSCNYILYDYNGMYMNYSISDSPPGRNMFLPEETQPCLFELSLDSKVISKVS